MKRLILIFMLWLVSCAPVTQFVSPEYAGKKLQGGRLAIVKPTSDALYIENADDVVDDLGKGNATEIYSAFLDSQVVQSIRMYGAFKKVRVAEPRNRTEFERTTFTIGTDKTMEISLPAEGKPAAFDSTFDFALIIGRLNVSRFAGQAGMYMPGPNGVSFSGGSPAALVHDVTYAIWDNKAGKVVCYGQFSSQATIIFAMTRNTWENGILGFTQTILSKSPFYTMAY
jgi:hypothetical protein